MRERERESEREEHAHQRAGLRRRRSAAELAEVLRAGRLADKWAGTSVGDVAVPGPAI